jgi:hypothetical protein
LYQYQQSATATIVAVVAVIAITAIVSIAAVVARNVCIVKFILDVRSVEIAIKKWSLIF